MSSLTWSEGDVINRIYSSYKRGSHGPWTVKYKKARNPMKIVEKLNWLIGTTQFAAVEPVDQSETYLIIYEEPTRLTFDQDGPAAPVIDWLKKWFGVD